jgi:hypothetical protein
MWLPVSSLALSTGLSNKRTIVQIDLHLVSDSTGETIETIAKAALAQFDDVAVRRHFWPMVRSVGHLERIIPELTAFPGLVLYSLVNSDVRQRFEIICRDRGLTAIPVLDPVVDALSMALGQQAKGRPGGQHNLDAAYFARVEAIHWTMSHDDGLLSDEWEQADIVLAGVSRSSKTPTSVYLANRGYKTANIPIVPASPPPDALFRLRHPLVIGLTTSADRLVAVRRNRLSAIGDIANSDYAAEDAVKAELAYARRMFADQGWPVIDVTRRSIEETAAAIIRLVEERRSA